MVSFFRIFKALPKPGDIYVLDDDVDPWSDKRQKVEVIETMPGWVRYKFCGSSVYTDERLRRTAFHFCYEKMPNPTNPPA